MLTLNLKMSKVKVPNQHLVLIQNLLLVKLTLLTQTSNLDGSYKATDHDGDQHLLQINGASGTWTETEVDGSKEIKQVQVDATNQRLIVGDDVKTYQQNGNQLIVSELDDDPDTLNFTKQ